MKPVLKTATTPVAERRMRSIILGIITALVCGYLVFMQHTARAGTILPDPQQPLFNVFH